MTRVTEEYLAALETGDWEVIPPAFRRGYLTLYARAVGMNSSMVLRAYDRLQENESVTNGAVLDDSPPLIRQPEHRGVTRAKIRTSWFAAFSRNKRAMYPVTLLAVLLIVAVAITLRRLPRDEVTPRTWVESLSDYQRTVRGPRTVISLAGLKQNNRVGDSQHQWCELRSWEPGVIRFSLDEGSPRTIHFRSYDTLIFEYSYFLSLVFYPPSSANIFHNDTLVHTKDNINSLDTVKLLFDMRPGREELAGDSLTQLH